VAGKIKSSVELAMEKMAKLPRLTKEELRERQHREYEPRGRAIAARFLAGDLEATRLDAELSRYGDEPGRIVWRAFITALCQSIDLEDARASARVLEGVGELARDDRVRETSSRLSDLLRDYREQRQRRLQATQGAPDPRLRDLGLSGSAIRVNPDQNQAWLQARSELRQRFLPEVDRIGRELADHLLESGPR
jgi:hypothetical protein